MIDLTKKQEELLTMLIEEDLNDSDKWVRYEAIKHLNANAEHIDKALNDPSELIRRTIQS